MCDVLVAMPDSTKNGKILFGKNSDRPSGECQVLSYSPGGTRNTGRLIECSYMKVPEISRVLATMGCRPHWCWGYETGINEKGVVGGNTAVFTRLLGHAQEDQPLGLTGMDLLRLGLERGQSAEEAVGVIVNFLEEYGQWGSAVRGKNHKIGSYENAFLIADRKEAWVLETSGHRWIAEKINQGSRSISNQLTIRNNWTKRSIDLEYFAQERGWWNTKHETFDFALAYSDHEHYPRQVSHIRYMRSQNLLHDYKKILDVRIMMRILRDHYEGTFLQGPQFHPFLPDFHTLCMHESPAGFTWGNTATSMIVEIDSEDSTPPTLWLCYLPPCISIYTAFSFLAPVPEVVMNPGKAGLNVYSSLEAPEDTFSESSLWWRFNRILEAVRNDPIKRQKEVRVLFDPLEEQFIVKVDEIERISPGERKQAFRRFVPIQISEVLAAVEKIEKRWNLTKN